MARKARITSISDVAATAAYFRVCSCDSGNGDRPSARLVIADTQIGRASCRERVF